MPCRLIITFKVERAPGPQRPQPRHRRLAWLRPQLHRPPGGAHPQHQGAPAPAAGRQQAAHHPAARRHGPGGLCRPRQRRREPLEPARHRAGAGAAGAPRHPQGCARGLPAGSLLGPSRAPHPARPWPCRFLGPHQAGGGRGRARDRPRPVPRHRRGRRVGKGERPPVPVRRPRMTGQKAGSLGASPAVFVSIHEQHRMGR